jgi:predicted RNA-binding Zn-ribbon protein involved in translation (DUF1610 family)
MRAIEFINEGVTFGVGKLEVQPNGEKWVRDPFARTVTTNCDVCHGSGVEIYSDHGHEASYPCPYCDGKKTITRSITDAPDIDVSMGNASTIFDMLGVKTDAYEHVGIISHKDLPEVMRRLIRTKNGNTNHYTNADYEDPRKMIKTKNADGMDQIGYNGPRMVHFGRTQSKIDGYLERLIKLVQFAQKNNCDIRWS